SFVTVPANSIGGPRGGNRDGGFQGFNPGGFQGFNPGGVQGFNPGGVQGFNPGGVQGFNPRGVQGFNPGQAGRPFKSEFSEHERFFPRQRFQRSFAWAGGYLVGGYGAPFSYDSTYYDPTLGDPLLYPTPADNPSGLSTPPTYGSVV